RFRFTLDASGTIDVYKIGNIASAAATFVLETGDTLSDTSLCGVAAFQTNFDFLLAYGIDLRGSALLQITTSSRTQTEPLTLEGIPGGVASAAPAAVRPALLASLPTDTSTPVAPSGGWGSPFGTPPTDRELDGYSGGDDAL